MALKLPEEKGRKIKPPPMVQHDALSPEDTIEYSITVEVSPQRGQKAWIKMGTASSIRDGETTEQARERICSWVEEELDRRIDELA